ncbi:hypothetical protein E4U41_003514 [Claviceps citrina]|nr:hypothetical protein E4U41_003514 [Claviceps citrina]
MTAIDLQKACMADLGRQRQDELPLGKKEGKRPSYEPGRGNGTAHYAPSLKKDLANKWKVQIQDEESAEMQGLVIGDSRPWAKMTEKEVVSRHDNEAAPSKPKTQNPSRREARPKSDSTFIGTSLPTRPKPLDSKKVVYNGQCKFLDAKSRKPLFPVTCAMKIQESRSKAFLVLSASNRPDRTHNVLEMSAPDIQDDCCRLYSREMVSRCLYDLQFPNASDARKFGFYLESLQKAAARTLGAPSISSNQSKKTEIPPSLRVPASPTETVSAQKASEPRETSDIVTELIKTDVESPSTTSGQETEVRIFEDAAEPQESSAIVAKLIDVDSPSKTSDQETKVDIFEDAAELLFNLIEKILPQAAAAGLNFSEDAISDIPETADEVWLKRGFLRSETDDMQPELFELLRILVRIKRKAESRKHSHAAEFKQDLKSADAKTKRIQYSLSEIQNLSSSSVATPAGLDKSMVTPRRTRAVGGCLSAASAALMSKNKAWLNGDSAPQRPDATIRTPPMSNGKLNAVSKGCPEAPNAANKGDISSPRSPSKNGGLGTSR